METLAVEIFQPFAQFRNPFTFDYAQTYPLSPKSTVTGMLQNATGRYYDQDISEISVSIHGLFESTFWNYQSFIVGDIALKYHHNKLKLWNKGYPLYSVNKKSQRSPSYQQELFNGHYYIFLRGDDDIIEEVCDSLRKPTKPLSLGRSEDIIFIRGIHRDFEVIEREVKKNLWMTYPTYIKLSNGKTHFPIRNERFPVYSIPERVIFRNGESIISNKAEIGESTERIPTFQTVIYTGMNQVIFLNDTVRTEIYKLEDGSTFKIPADFGWL
ncbi:unknown [Methanothermobacter thermautotrophicus str. Delta H]|uniref:Type I-B CRISPR-associated protein Cas5 n=1 Tax=Methanothermobacter thermautotrophicus (strain ATCC 29096 / DSM 1053 / JCM 10044 / NBRC 100330 / Delta H) TaxID=187420 RepID=O27159_METTH|nr:CRISPR-associated protein Cas5 [Methanothermobacter thermautotrophicus]AAB85576.1 unknown [Methanothermobacter thermautotrophicus str. Delta H]WBF05655.1 CRISPR-associated protein Cas5 [Methanothermobacter thermautotrophicus]